MTTPEMHVMFRQFAQQMGMQNVRAILPEQIDLVLNTSQTDIVNQIIKENIGITNDRVVTDNSKLGQINALRTLYTVAIIPLSEKAETAITDNRCFKFDPAEYYSGRLSSINCDKGRDRLPAYMYLVDFSVNYREVINVGGYSTDTYPYDVGFAPNGMVTNYFPVRLIDDAYLADTLNDFVLAPRFRSPILVTYSIKDGKVIKPVFDLYFGKFDKTDTTPAGSSKPTAIFKLANKFVPYRLRISYIAKPTKIEFNEDLGISNGDCQLPEYLHVDVVKHAVNLFRAALQGSALAAQAQEQQAQQENMRNNYRNEGNTQ